MRLIAKLLIYIGFAFFLMPTGCKKDEVRINEEDKKTVREDVRITSDVFEEWYLWYKDIPELDLSLFDTPDEYIQEILYKDDRWSFSADLDWLMALIEQGETEGWGAGLKWDAENNLRIAFVYDDSSIGKAGVKRGWIIKSLNGKLLTLMTDEEINSAISAPSADVVFITPDGTEKQLSIARDVIKVNTVLHKSVFDRGGKKVGYLVFNEFLDVSGDELDNAFSYFLTEGVSSIILDLRYNGGGTLDAASYLAGLIAGTGYDNKIYNNQEFNDKHTDENVSNVIHAKANSLTPEELVIISTHSTASASELIIAGLYPYLDITLIGTTTHGKPVGMNVFSVENLNLAIGPVSFRNVNMEGFTDYFGGIAVDYTVNDDLTRDFGDENELCLKAALNYIESGSIGDVAMKAARPEPGLLYWGVDKPLRELISFKESDNIKF